MPSTEVRQNATIILFFALLSVSSMLFMAINTGQRFGPLPPQYRVAFEVKDADGLVEGSDVRIAGVPVGKVLAVTTSGNGAVVTLGIEPGKGYDPVFTDGSVLIRPKSLLGEKYVDMQRGTSNVEIPDGGMLPPTQAFTQVELDQVLNSSDAKTRQAISENIINLGQGVDGRGQDINPTIPELRRIAEHLTSVSSRFKDRTTQIDHILVDTDTILSTLADEHSQLDTLLQSADGVTGTVAQNDKHLAGILNGAGGTFSKINVALAQQNNDQNIRSSIQRGPALLTKLNTFLGLTTHDLNTLVPSLLLGQQFNYPSDQLTVVTPTATQIDKEWDSGFRAFDPGPGGTGLAATPPVGNFHGFIAMGMQCDSGTYACPGAAAGKAPGYGALSAMNSSDGSSTTGSPTSTATLQTATAISPASSDMQRIFLAYLLGN